MVHFRWYEFHHSRIFSLKKHLHRGPFLPLIDISFHSVLVPGGPAVSSLSTSCWTWRKGKGWWTSITVSGSCGHGGWTWCRRRYCAPISPHQFLDWSPGPPVHPYPPVPRRKETLAILSANSLKEKVTQLAAFLSFLPSPFSFSFHNQTKKPTSLAGNRLCSHEPKSARVSVSRSPGESLH